MAGTDEEPKLSVPKFSSFKTKDADIAEVKEVSRRTVPKFSSFKSRESDAPTKADDSRSQDRERRKRSHHDRESRHSSKRRRHESDSRHRLDGRPRRSRSPQRKQDEPTIKASSLKDKLPASDLFFIDLKGDPLLRRYGYIDRAQIPPYYRYGRGRVLGTNGRLIIHPEGSRDEFSLRFPGEGWAGTQQRDGLRSKTWRASRQPLHLRPRKQGEAETAEEDDGYLAFSSPKRRRSPSRESASSDEEAAPNYRSVEGKAKARPIFSDEESDSEDEVDLVDHNDPLRLRSVQLNRQVKDRPEDINTWLALADHQDALFRAGHDPSQEEDGDAQQSFTEIKLAILEKALVNAVQPPDRQRILSRLMREGGRIWTPKKLEKRWTEILKDEDDSFILWKGYLDYIMSDIVSFGYERVQKTLLDRMHRAMLSAQPNPTSRSYSEAIYLFLRLTRFTHDAGYKELATAAWQGLLEMNFFRPRGLDGSAAALQAFGDFWESEVPRIGETDAKGWRHFVETGGTGDAPEPVKQSEHTSQSSRNVHEAWAYSECWHAQEANLPARTMDEGTESDPFRVVMCSDIEPMLFLVPNDLLPYVREQMWDAFLIFTGLPPSRGDEYTDMALQDPALAGPANIVDAQGAWHHEFDSSEDSHHKPPNFERIPMDAAMSSDLLFPGSKWFSCLAPAINPSSTDLAWVQKVLRQLVCTAQVGHLAVYYLALGVLDESANTRKIAKGLLKQYPANIELYDAYALAEYSQGNNEIAEKVVASATQLKSDGSDSDQLLLWRHWAWMSLEAGDQTTATKRLCSAVVETLRANSEEGSQVSSIEVMRCRQTFASNASYMISMGNLQAAAIQAECLALLVYLTADGCTEPTSAAQGNITAAMDCIDGTSMDLKSRGHEATAAHERVLQFGARLLYHNTTRGAFRRCYVRERLTVYMESFPRNTIFLSLMEWADAGLRVIDETRLLLHDKVLIPPNDVISSRVFAIEHELARGNVNTTRRAFRQALESDACRMNPWIWISYIRFCCGEKELQRTAEKVFFEALRHCPWSKDLMMEAFGTLRRQMQPADLRSVYDTMVSKGFRIHVDWDDFSGQRR